MLSILAAIILSLAMTPAQDSGQERKGAPYLLDVCPITGRPLPEGGGVVVVVSAPNDAWLDGREVRVCCNGCAKKVRTDPIGPLAKADALIIADQGPRYPLLSCVVMTKRDLPENLADCTQVVYKNRLVRMCCERCLRRFHADPAAYLKVLDAAAIRAQSATYPLTTCLITGAVLGDSAEAFLIGDRLVKTCCGNCRKKVEADPRPYLAILAAARPQPKAAPVKGDTKGLPAAVIAAISALAPDSTVASSTKESDRFIVTLSMSDGSTRTIAISPDGWVLADSST